MIQYDYGHENLQGFLAEGCLGIANNAAKQKRCRKLYVKMGKTKFIISD